jgi:hypothetical protein
MPDMQDHFDNFFDTLDELDEILFFEVEPTDENAWLEVLWRNETAIRRSMTVEEIEQFIGEDLRVFLLAAKIINITVPIGKSDEMDVIKLEASYTIEKKWLLKANLKPILSKIPSKFTVSTNISRIFVMITATLLMIYELRMVVNALSTNRKITRN